MTPTIIEIALGVYIVLLAAGGAIGYLKAKSRPSLIAGLASALLCAIGLGLAVSGSAFGFQLSWLVALLLTFLFGFRLFKSRKFMPSGFLAIVSLAMVALLSSLLLSGGK